MAKGIRQDDRSNYASASPVTDGKKAIFFYGNGDLVCFDLAGSRRWAQHPEGLRAVRVLLDLQQQPAACTTASCICKFCSATCPCEGAAWKDRENESYLLALDPENGQDLWRTSGPARPWRNRGNAFSTPIPFIHDGRDEAAACRRGRAKRPRSANGQGIVAMGHLEPHRGSAIGGSFASPVAGGGLSLVCVPKGDPVYAVKAGGTGTLDDRAAGMGQPARTGRSLPMFPRPPFTTAISSCSATFAEIALPRRTGYGQGQVDRLDAGAGQVRSLAAGRGREDLPDQFRRTSGRARAPPTGMSST